MERVYDIELMNKKFQDSLPTEVLQHFIKNFKGRIALSSSMSAEDQVLTKLVTDIDKSVKIFTLDTGRLFPETYSLIDRTNSFFGIKILIYFPDNKAVEEIVSKKGMNLFYNSIEDRKLCCKIRKIEPLKRAFKGLKVWICGLRREQSITRNEMNIIEWDNTNNLIKLNPLINWTESQVWDYVNLHSIPYNKLHDESFPSIGCQPCTRAIKSGEDLRAGRWWWENPESKECGLHSK